MRFDANHAWNEGDAVAIAAGQWLGDQPDPTRPRAEPSVAISMDAAARTRRSAFCSCGSGLRFKHCCGWQSSNDASRNASALEIERQAALVHRAASLMQRGEAARAAALLDHLRPELMTTALQSREAGEMCIDVDKLQCASIFLERAIALGGNDPHTRESMDECRRLLDRPKQWLAAAKSLRTQLGALNERATTGAPISHVHIVCKLDTLGGTESRALNLYRQLSLHGPTTLWSTRPVLAAHAARFPIREITASNIPSGGTLALIGTYFECGPWLNENISTGSSSATTCRNNTPASAVVWARLKSMRRIRKCGSRSPRNCSSKHRGCPGAWNIRRSIWPRFAAGCRARQTAR